MWYVRLSPLAAGSGACVAAKSGQSPLLAGAWTGVTLTAAPLVQLYLGVAGSAEDVGSRGEVDRDGAAQQQVAVAFGAGAGEAVQLHVVMDGQADGGPLGDGQCHIRQM